MKRLVFYLLFICSVTLGNAQVITIEGKVTGENAHPVSFASVVILKDTSAIAEKISAEDGSFKISLPRPGNYNIKVSHASYSDFSREMTVQASLDAGAIVLSKKENQLGAVTVTAKKAFITKKIDRIVMDVQNNALAGGKSSLELFQLAPGVFVNDGKISINGNPGTRVMVDGKMLQLSGDDLTNYLSSLRAEEIQSIEVIAHPPAEYDAEGSGGYINIILKKQKQAGLNGTLNAGYTQGRYAGTNEGIQLNYKRNRLALFTNYVFDKSKNFEDSKFSRSISDSVSYRSQTNRINNYTTHRVHAGGTYDISSKQYIALDYTGTFTDGSAGYNAIININYPSVYNNQTVIGNYPRNNSRNYHNVGLNYHINLDKAGSGFVLLSDYTRTNSKVFSSAVSNFYDYEHNFLSDTAFRNYTPSAAKIYTTDAKYTKVFSKNSTFSAGGKINVTSIDNSAVYEGYSQNLWVNKSTLNYIYDYRERIVAGYLNYNGKLGKATVQLGVRGEYTHTEGELITSHINTERNYFNLFPTVFVKHPANKTGNNYFTFYYGRRISRPSYSDLNPYEFYADNYSIARGNPYLNPSFTNSFELGYTLKGKYSIAASYDRQKDMIAQYATQLPADSLITIYTHDNFGKRTNAAITLYVPVALTKWWTWNNNVIVRREAISMHEIEIKKTIFTVQSNQAFILPKQFSINLNASYISNTLSGNFLFDPIFTMNIGVQKKLMKGKMVVKTSANDIFNSYRINADIYYSSTNIGRMEQRRQTRTFSFSMVYNFDLGKSFKMKAIQNSNADEQSRLQ
jgi:outer membrane receptor protein involved in Fe transport